MGVIEHALHERDRPWTGGPFAEPARQWLRDHHAEVRDRLADATRLIGQMATREDPLVVTHGEPHPGNTITTTSGLVLIDWDTVGLAYPERDLWMMADDPALLEHYAAITGRGLDPRAIALHDLGWKLSDLAGYLEVFRSPHDRSADTTHAWNVLEQLTWRD